MLRRAMGKKDKEEMSRQREKFLQGSLKNSIEEKTATAIFDKIEKFASYGFNKSHAAAYAYLSYVTAYMKANFPKEWLAALMTSDRDDLSKVAKFILEAKSMGIGILPPDVNNPSEDFIATKEGIRFAISGIKGIGKSVVEAILKERLIKPFENLYDFIKRIDTSKVSKKNIELMIAAGCFDFSGWPRDAMQENLDSMYEKASKEQKEESKGIMNFFSLIEEDTASFRYAPAVKSPSSCLDILRLEKELLGFYLTGHPMDAYQNLTKRLSCVPLRDFAHYQGDLLRSAFIVESLQYKISNKNQKKFAVLTISDGIERFELPIWSEMYEEKSALLKENMLLFAILHKEIREDNIRLTCKYLEDLSNMEETGIKIAEDLYESLKRQNKSYEAKKRKDSMPKENSDKPFKVQLTIDADQMRLSHVLEIKAIFRKFSGKSRVELHFFSAQKKIGSLFIDSSWGIEANLDCLNSLKGIGCLKNVSIE